MADRKRVAWALLSAGCGVLAGLATRQVATVAWRAAVHEDPPENPADRRTGWPSALIWAITVGVGVGVSRLVATRLASTAWELVADEPPPGVQPEHSS